MIDMGTIASTIGSIKTAGEIAKGFLDLKEATAFQGKVIELQGVIMAAQTSALAAQSDQFTLLNQVRELETKMAKLEAWEAQKKRYSLKDFGGGTFAYELKEAERAGEPIHRICPACYEKGHRSILQFDYRTSSAQDRYKCPGCKTDFEFGVRQQSQPRSARGSSSDYF